MSSTTTGDHAARRITHTNARQNARARGQEWQRAHETPRSIAWCLANPGLASPRFTPYQWAILVLGWGQWSGYRPSEHVALALNERASQVRQARTAAERLAYELYHCWRPALEAWQHRKACHECADVYLHRKLDRFERSMLAKHRLDRPKKGRRPAPVQVRAMPSVDPSAVGGVSVTNASRHIGDGAGANTLLDHLTQGADDADDVA